MLVLTRKLEESLIIGDNIEVKVLEIRGDHVRLGIVAPRQVSVYRTELYESIKAANKEAVKGKKEKVAVPFFKKKGGQEERV